MEIKCGVPKVLSNPLKEAFKTKEVQYGVWVDSTTPVITEIVASCGYDWMLYDGEHAPNTVQSMYQQLQVAECYGTQAIGRVLENSDAYIKQILDLGFKSIMVPMIETKADAERAVRAMRYPPHGVRGVGGAVTRACRWGRTPEYIQKADQTLCLVAQTETINSMKHLEEIAAVDGVDALFIGPLDLATSMGFQGDATRPEVMAVVEDHIKRVRRAGKTPGVFAVNPEVADKYIEWGVGMLALGCELNFLISALEGALARYKPGKKVTY